MRHVSDTDACRPTAGASDPARTPRLRPALIAFASLLFAACSEPPDYDLRHPFDAMPDLALQQVAVGDTTRPFAAFAPGQHEFALGSIRAGFLRTHLAVDFGQAKGTADAKLSLRDAGFGSTIRGDAETTCTSQWRASEPQTAWLDCRLPIARNFEDARLTLDFEAPAAARLRVSSPILVAGDAQKRPDVFVIVLDTARADVFSSYDERLPTSPNLAALARDAIVFDELRAPSSWTRASVATLLTGLSQTRHHVFSRLHPLSAELPTLQHALHDHGYESMAWSTNPNILPIWGFASGFDQFVDVGVVDWKTDKPDADAVFERARATLDSNVDVPGYYYLHLMDPHHPYKPPKNDAQALRRLVREQPELYPTPALTQPGARAVRRDYQNYVAEIRDLDRKLGAFLDHLRDSGRYDDALILVVSDHGEEFLDHGDRYHGISLYDESLRVPGILKLPGGERAGSRISRPVGLVDMFATLAATLGFDPPENTEGVDVLDPASPALPQVSQLVLDQYRKTAIVFEGWKLIVDHVTGTRELYHVAEDPREREDRFAQEPEQAALLQELLDRMAALHEEGWHLRGCGCQAKGTLQFVARANGAEVRWLGSEGRDTLEPQPAAGSEPATFAVSMDLKPTLSQQLRFGRRIKRFLADEDELLMHAPEGAPAAFDLEIAPAGDAGLRVAIGQSEPETLNTARVIAADAANALVDVGEPVNCRDRRPAAARPSEAKPAPCEPYVRIWRVAPAKAVSETSVDPDISERLKALGYSW